MSRTVSWPGIVVPRGILLLCVMLLSGCATLLAERDPPRVSVEGVRSLPSDNGSPRFEVILRIANPNKQALDIAGISYTVDILGRELVTGVSNEIPRIDGYTEETVRLKAGVNLLELLRLLAELGRSQHEALEYRVAAKIDFRGVLPTQRVEEIGTLRLD